MRFPQPLPSGDSLDDRFARELALLLGTAYQPADGTLIAEDLRVLGGALGDVYTTQSRALDEAFCNTSIELLEKWEFRLGIPTNQGASVSDRQVAATAKRRAVGGTHLRMIKALEVIDSTVAIVPTKAALVAGTDPRKVFQFAIVVSSATLTDSRKKPQIERVIDAMKPAYCGYSIVTRVGFVLGVSRLGQDALG
jgi:hypothetical protein